MTSEFDLIKRYFLPLSSEQGLGLRDDAACFASRSGFDNVVTKDIIVEGTHFRSEDHAKTVGYKALAVNVSDCIAKGANPYIYWLGLSVPQSTPESWFASFTGGLKEAQIQFGCNLAGGDTTAHKGQGTTISITLLGHVPTGQMVKRSTAVVGDDLYVTGTLGDSAIGLKSLIGGIDGLEQLKQSYTMPSPPFGISDLLLEVATASADVSDGLIADVGHICSASGTGCVVFENKLPVSQAAMSYLDENPDQRHLIWSGGDDYQTIFTAHKDLRTKISAQSRNLGMPITRIGYITKSKPIHLLDLNGKKLQVSQQGYTHF